MAPSKIAAALENDKSGVLTTSMLNEMKELIAELKIYRLKENLWYSSFND